MRTIQIVHNTKQLEEEIQCVYISFVYDYYYYLSCQALICSQYELGIQ